jgi:hypothetical protein
VDPCARSQTRYKQEASPVLEAARNTHLGRIYFDWAQYPIVEVETEPNAYLVHFYDLRFQYPDLERRRGRTLGAQVLLDQNLHEVAEWFGSRAQRPDVFGPQREKGN